jgi:hypothetical protein
MRKIILLALLLCSLNRTSSAQAIKYYPVTINEVHQHAGGATSGMGFGYEQNIGDRLSWGVNFLGSFPTPATISETKVYPSELIHIDCNHSVSWWQLQYQSKYFAKPNDGSSFYFSSSIAVQSRTQKVEVVSITDFNAYTPLPSYDGITSGSIRSQNDILIPVSFSMGVRGSLDGFFGDVYVGASYLFKSNYTNKNLVTERFGKNYSYADLAVTFGLAIGIGWADD